MSIVSIAAEPGYGAAADRQWQHAADSESARMMGKAFSSQIRSQSG